MVDGDWAMVGSANLDYRSLFVDYELHLVTRDSGLSSEFERQFLDDLGVAERILPVQWQTRGWKARLFETVGWIARCWF